ncbi:MAG TPA: hypothetical protein VKA70_14675 [Blastocatellia bacterium]|nr:hypothetical protein [Blastocatellia bacterium]
MMEPRKNRERSRLHALSLLCALAALLLSGGVNLLDTRPSAGQSPLNDVELIAHLSVKDSAMGRMEKRIPTLESKRYRRQLQHAQTTQGGEMALLGGRTFWTSPFQDEQGQKLVAISPPADRAPPV